MDFCVLPYKKNVINYTVDHVILGTPSNNTDNKDITNILTDESLLDELWGGFGLCLDVVGEERTWVVDSASIL